MAALATLADMAASRFVAQIDTLHVCQIQLAELADMAEKPLRSQREETADARR